MSGRRTTSVSVGEFHPADDVEVVDVAVDDVCEEMNGHPICIVRHAFDGYSTEDGRWLGPLDGKLERAFVVDRPTEGGPHLLGDLVTASERLDQ